MPRAQGEERSTGKKRKKKKSGKDLVEKEEEAEEEGRKDLRKEYRRRRVEEEGGDLHSQHYVRTSNGAPALARSVDVRVVSPLGSGGPSHTASHMVGISPSVASALRLIGR